MTPPVEHPHPYLVAFLGFVALLGLMCLVFLGNDGRPGT